MQLKSRIHADDLFVYTDLFDLIPDSIVLLVFNKLADVRSLGRCSAVSKRFNSLVLLVHDMYVKIDEVVTADGDADVTFNSPSSRSRNPFSHFFRVFFFNVLKPFNNLRSANTGHRSLLPQLSHHSPAHVLKNYTHIRNLHIELPAGDVGMEDGVLLKWRAEFGSTLQNCVILGGTRIDRKSDSSSQELPAVDDNGSIPESFYTNGGLKLRVVWTISSLIAASTRHYLLRPIIKDHPTLTSLVLTDADGQGTLRMGKDQLREFREKPLSASASSSRTQVPFSNMKLQYAAFLELPDGIGLQGATLVSIKPSGEGIGGINGSSRKETENFVSTAFDEPLRATAKSLMKQRTYLLEMNGF